VIVFLGSLSEVADLLRLVMVVSVLSTPPDARFVFVVVFKVVVFFRVVVAVAVAVPDDDGFFFLVAFLASDERRYNSSSAARSSTLCLLSMVTRLVGSVKTFIAVEDDGDDEREL
jgi:hypothetical protein